MPLFKRWEDSMILSCLQGYMGNAYVDNDENYQSAQIIIADFCFFTGEVTEELVKNKPKEYQKDYMIMVPQNQEWGNAIEKVYGNQCEKITRFSLKKEKVDFNREKLTNIVKNLNECYEIKLIDKELFTRVLKEEWSEDLCRNFKNDQDYKEHGLGVVVLHQDEIVSGASSYSCYKEGIEIEIDTRKEYRSKGLASACGAKLILECLDRNLNPNWDAHNKISLSLAEKLGYYFDKEYIAYEVTL